MLMARLPVDLIVAPGHPTAPGRAPPRPSCRAAARPRTAMGRGPDPCHHTRRAVAPADPAALSVWPDGVGTLRCAGSVARPKREGRPDGRPSRCALERTAPRTIA